MWNIQKIVSKGDYCYGVVKEHPNSTKHGYVLLHRLVMENHLNRLLNNDEIVHHKNGNKKDNNIDNLEVMTRQNHASYHGSLIGKTICLIKCPNCGENFTKEKNQTHLTKGGTFTFCSRKCNGQFYRKVQLYGITHEMNTAVSVNILKEFNSLDNTEETDTTGSVETKRSTPEMVKL